MDDLRIALIVIGVLLIAGIWVFEVLRRRAARRRDAWHDDGFTGTREDREAADALERLGDRRAAANVRVVSRRPPRPVTDEGGGPDIDDLDALEAGDPYLPDDEHRPDVADPREGGVRRGDPRGGDSRVARDPREVGAAGESGGRAGSPSPAASPGGSASGVGGPSSGSSAGGDAAVDALRGLRARRDAPEQLDLGGLGMVPPEEDRPVERPRGASAGARVASGGSSGRGSAPAPAPPGTGSRDRSSEDSAFRDEGPHGGHSAAPQPDARAPGFTATTEPGARGSSSPGARASADPSPGGSSPRSSGSPRVSAEDPSPAPPKEELVVVISVLARSGERFAGPDLVPALAAAGLRLGEDGLFHRRPADEILFSAVNVVKPGIFDPEAIEALETPGIALFLRVPGPGQPGERFEEMVRTAHDVAERIGGVLCDEARSTLTQQALNHLRERIADHERRRLLPS